MYVKELFECGECNIVYNDYSSAAECCRDDNDEEEEE